MKNEHSDIEADLQIGPTDRGMVRFIVSTPKGIFNLEFDPEEAIQIAEEIQAASSKATKIK